MRHTHSAARGTTPVQELTTITSNVHVQTLPQEDGGHRHRPCVEVVLVTSEPAYELSNTGDLVKSRTTQNFRFLASTSGLRRAAEIFAGLADEADALAKVAGMVEPEH